MIDATGATNQLPIPNNTTELPCPPNTESSEQNETEKIQNASDGMSHPIKWQGGCIEIRVVGFQNQCVDKNGLPTGIRGTGTKQAIFFVVQCAWKPALDKLHNVPPYTWYVLKRYSQFEALHSYLNLTIAPALRSLPPKYQLSGWSKTFLPRRQVALQAYLQQNIRTHPILLENAKVAKFLNLKFGIESARKHFLSFIRETREVESRIETNASIQ